MIEPEDHDSSFIYWQPTKGDRIKAGICGILLILAMLGCYLTYVCCIDAFF